MPFDKGDNILLMNIVFIMLVIMFFTIVVLAYGAKTGGLVIGGFIISICTIFIVIANIQYIIDKKLRETRDKIENEIKTNVVKVENKIKEVINKVETGVKNIFSGILNKVEDEIEGGIDNILGLKSTPKSISNKQSFNNKMNNLIENTY